MVSRLLHLAKNGSFGSKLPINYGTPKVLPRKIRSLLAKHFGVEEKVLTHADAPAAGAVGTTRARPDAATTPWRFMKSMCAHRPARARSMKGWRRDSDVAVPGSRCAA